MFPFGPKKQEQMKAYVPVDLVQRYASQGMPEGEIVSRLRSQGFSPGQVDTALRAVLRERITGPSRQEQMRQEDQSKLKEQFPTMQMIPAETGVAPMPSRRPPEPVQQAPSQQQPEQEEQSRFTFEDPQSRFSPESEVTLEEIIEGIVADKWNAFEQRLANFEERDLQLEEQIHEIRSAMKDLAKLINSKEENLSGRFEQFGDSVSTIEGRIGSIEKVFKEFVPELSKNVRILSERAENK